jgi:hypothetical protein
VPLGLKIKAQQCSDVDYPFDQFPCDRVHLIIFKGGSKSTEENRGMLERNKWFRQGYKAEYAATAALLGVTPRTLQRWHNAGIGPKRVPGPDWLSVLYRRSEVEQWKSAKVQTPAISGHSDC